MSVLKLKNFLLISLFFCCGASVVASGPVFSIDDKAETKVKWRGSHLISGDNLTFFDKKGFAEKAQQVESGQNDKWRRIVNIWSNAKDLPFRKEVALSADGKEVELNIRADLPAYHQKPDVDSFGYYFRIPMSLVKGMKYTAITGRTSKPRIVSGVINGKEKSLFKTKARYWALEGNGKKIVIDFNPEGVQSFGDYGPGAIIGLWSVRQTPDYLECGIGIRNTEYGGVLSGKVRIFEGGMSDYPKRHAYGKYVYFSELPVEKQFCFGAKKHGKEFTNAGLEKYSPQKGFGWLEPLGMKISSERSSGAVYSAAKGSGNKVFRYDLPRPGLYVFTIRCAGYKTPDGAFSISSNGKEIVKDLNIPVYTLKNISWSQWIDDGKLELKLSGKNFTISVFGAQLLQHRCEDFKFRRGFWIVDGYEPHPVNSNKAFSAPAEYGIAVTGIKLPEKPITDPDETPLVPAGDICLPDQNAPEMAWRYNATIGSLGPSNNGTFTEFDTPALVERRLKQIKEKNINSILLNGLLSRLTFPVQDKRVRENIKLIAAKGHDLNMKILDHQDLTLLWNMGGAFRVMTKRLGMTQRSINGNYPTRGFCLTNKDFNNWYYPWIIKHIRETDIDGIMIDEACYHSAVYCGCVDCRRKFTADTGLTLPFDETSPLLYNKNSKLWKAWLQWRMKATADWSVELRRKIMPFKPYFTIMRYTTHYGYASTYASLSHGTTLSGAARSCDFLGTEIMSRNVMAAYRAVFAFRKAKTALRFAFGSPIFGLVYPLQSMDLAYFGWAMNNMNSQVTWMMIGRNDDKSPFTSFKENMNLRLAKPVADIAIMYSIQSRDWPKYMAVVPDEIGMSQALTDRHIMHDFFMERSLTLDFLKKYRVVMLNCDCCLSDTHIASLLAYVKQGGTLYMTATTGLLDQMGNNRKVWPLELIAGVELPGNRVRFLKQPLLRFPGKKPVRYNAGVIRIATVKNNEPEIIAEVVDAKGKVIQPLAVQRRYGKGRIIYCAAAFGAANYEPETTYMRKWTYSMNKEVDAFNGKMIDLVIGKGALRFTPVRTPEKLLMSVYRQTVADKTSTLVHLLNAGGSTMKLNAVVPGIPPSKPAWPELKQDIIFDISLPGVKNAYIVSPDREGRSKISFKRISKGRYRVAVPGNLLKCYSIVYLEH